jgi:hypothetical protein
MTAIVTTVVTSAYLVVMLSLYLVYKNHYKEAKVEFKQEKMQMSKQVD